MELTLDWDRSLLTPFRGQALERAVTRALSKAGGDAIRGMKAESNRQIRARKRIKAGKVTKALPLTFPRGVKHLDDLAWRMDVSGAAFPLAAYPFRQVKRGVSVAVNAGKRNIVRGAFVATLKSGRTGIFRRVGKARLPIKELYTTRITDVFKDAAMIPAIQRRGQAVFSSSFSRLLPLELAKAKR